MSDGDLLLRAILAAPADDAPRLVYADWLDEQGDHERAEFIRVQIAIENARDNARSLITLCDRSATLRFHYDDQGRVHQRTDWTAGVGSDVCVFGRGFVREVWCWIGDLESVARKIFQAHPVEVVTLTDKWPLPDGITAGEFRWGWYRRRMPVHEDADDIHPKIFDLMKGTDSRCPYGKGSSHPFEDQAWWAWWPTEQAARTALSDACVLYGRRLVAKRGAARVRR